MRSLEELCARQKVPDTGFEPVTFAYLRSTMKATVDRRRNFRTLLPTELIRRQLGRGIKSNF